MHVHNKKREDTFSALLETNKSSRYLFLAQASCAAAVAGEILTRLANMSYLEGELGPKFFSSVTVASFHFVVPELATLHPLRLKH